MKFITHRLLFFTLVGSLTVFIATHAANDNNIFNMGKDTFCLPDELDVLNNIRASFPNIDGSDSLPSRAFFKTSISASDVKHSIPSYNLFHGSFESILLITVESTSSETIKKLTDPKQHANKLQLSSRYTNATVLYDKKSDFFRVSLDPLQPFVLWHVLRIKPEKGKVVPSKLEDYYIASCSSVGGLEGDSSNCEYMIEIDGYLVEIITTENNLHLVPQIDFFVANKLDTWKQACR